VAVVGRLTVMLAVARVLGLVNTLREPGRFWASATGLAGQIGPSGKRAAETEGLEAGAGFFAFEASLSAR
jgi:hypothetical protein